ncbi:hypothetical protein A3K48_02260 [candidate division WOR-1 bacterium RIFOXYA12_FULL_52_29]|uniref:Uncharacterized protein n=1 Tax=candidate division WOR-1 bacterium RIFOXYC12_FULL_54_18 TaxID=1802584 RepID=A0A1F4T4T2_UNCSA|nr:MAG: hypothetical protein A3K44_02260 [candidate division WOR-1 bacterium RIFOXYA2_FULL_51_19]OGC17398.1 MAG: hypothetical protein A3K48_02260 [candidate division WOR-1 bacterium RIFOXYA12_FULL_52_29]OGC26257.1 MAG: hypothetical protein A3K32_02255 [candidate division WOR-1 bacterium RIFOXYB2_FULL_45_9]OGC27815.1 MAG: hypothetical protein A3K49_02260 [candidate division WOR-1 bacterium RIFOXYC12_FULL_54_18]OGC29896.1 MAG: hypothetical protein A2346_04075 [candidate division WOR-1 bacterium R
MNAMVPFKFYTSSLLVEITGRRAEDLPSFLRILREIDASSIFYHVHHAFREYSFAPGQYSNDFARWVSEELEETPLAEKLASVNIKEVTDLETLRQALIAIVEKYLAESPNNRKALPGREFYFLRNTGIVIPTKYEAKTIEEFALALRQVGMRSIYYHFFDARLRLGHKTNDFSNWIRSNFNDEALAARIEALDPYFMTLDQLRDRIISFCLPRKKGNFIMNIISRLIKIS